MMNLLQSNRLQLSGQISGKVEIRFSPSGIGHAEFLFEHRSMQYEGQLQRQAYCKIRTVVGGDVFTAHSEQLQTDAQFVLTGFLSVRQQRNGTQEMVFYVQHLELSKENCNDKEASSISTLA
ncbi:MAG: primosomal replication protein N [Gammaproteobacteria bacterium]|jgi:primosomal replication protein N